MPPALGTSSSPPTSFRRLESRPLQGRSPRRGCEGRYWSGSNLPRGNALATNGGSTTKAVRIDLDVPKVKVSSRPSSPAQQTRNTIEIGFRDLRVGHLLPSAAADVVEAFGLICEESGPAAGGTGSEGRELLLGPSQRPVLAVAVPQNPIVALMSSYGTPRSSSSWTRIASATSWKL